MFSLPCVGDPRVSPIKGVTVRPGTLLAVLIGLISLESIDTRRHVEASSVTDQFQAGVFADSARTLDCVGGAVGTTFRQYLWAWLPPSAGATYVTIRINFPDNIGLIGRAILNERVMHLIETDFGDMGWEWNFLLSECTTGWILLARQDAVILTSDSSQIVISEAFSLARNCNFVLEGVSVLNNLRIGSGSCTPVSVERSTWGAVKALYSL